LRRSLAKFQRGETGEGRIVKEVRDADLPGVDDDYRSCVALFIAEEGRHARILGELVRSLEPTDAPRPRRADGGIGSLFATVRRLGGVEFELLVLMGAEVVGQGCYELLATQLPPGPIPDALRELVEDEKAHLAFHADYFARRAGTRPLAHLAFGALWWGAIGGATAIVLVDHGRDFSRMGIGPQRIVGRMASLASRARRAVSHTEARDRARSPISPKQERRSWGSCSARP
jgi:hypothetical protein